MQPVLSPGQMPEANAHMTLAPGISDGYLGNEGRAFADNQIFENGSRPGQVSERLREKKHTHR